MSKESEKHVDRVLNQISTRLESLTVSGPKLGDLSTLRSHMLRLLDKVSEQEIAAEFSTALLRGLIRDEKVRVESPLGEGTAARA